MKVIKFRAWDGNEIREPYMNDDFVGLNNAIQNCKDQGQILMQYTGIKDKNGVEIYEGDILRFSDKWEWYKLEWTWKLMGVKGEQKEKLIEEYNSLPYEERVIEGNEDYEWLLSGEIQQYWEVIGNIYENKTK